MNNTATYYFDNPNVVSFPKLGIEFSFDSTAFTVFGLEIRWYGVLIAAGMLLAMIYCFHRMKEFGLDSDRVIDAVLGGLIGGVFGARLYFIVFNSEETIADFFRIRDGGLAVYGGIIGGIIFGLIVARFRKVKALPLLDVASFGLFIGQALGRWGNFTNKEAFGSATELPWGMASASIQATLGSQYGDVVLAHPCFLYESLWCILGFVLLHFYAKHRKFDGELFLMYSAWYGFGRFFIEGLRMDSLYLGRLRVSQLLAAICVLAAVVTLLIVRSNLKRGSGAILYRDTEESKALLLEAEQREKASKKPRKEAVTPASEDESVPEITEEPAADTVAVEDGEEKSEAFVPDSEEENLNG